LNEEAKTLSFPPASTPQAPKVVAVLDRLSGQSYRFKCFAHIVIEA
jgi:hypothetical protein